MRAPTAGDRLHISGLGKIILSLIALVYFGIYLLLGNFNIDQLRSFGIALKIKVDLGLCSNVFARLVITQVLCTFLAVVAGGLTLLGSLVDIFTEKSAFATYRNNIFACVAFLIIAPLPWLLGNVFIAKRFNLLNACLGSNSALPLSVYFGVFIGLFSTFSAVAMPLITQYFVQNNVDPKALSNDPEMRARQLAARSILGYKAFGVADNHQPKPRSALSLYRFLAGLVIFLAL